ncbi:PIN domain nuclease [Streptomyces tendae]|uniref:PIN domain nuclease n=1 Tax=Streptomyces tendae TaxID=1932 RepID=A0ABX5ZJI2_STRTE|nr:PIN domain nuclease [Streptomyces tendae]
MCCTRRARVVQRELTAKGEHRSAGAVDLLVTARRGADGTHAAPKLSRV